MRYLGSRGPGFGVATVASMSSREVPEAFLGALRTVCLALPEAYEEQAWVGTRWMVRTKNFAHVVMIDDGWPPAYARAAELDGPAVVLTFRAQGPDLDALRDAGPPFFKPRWFDDIVGIVLDDDPPGSDPTDSDTDWDEVAALVTESYCVVAPKKLTGLL